MKNIPVKVLLDEAEAWEPMYDGITDARIEFPPCTVCGEHFPDKQYRCFCKAKAEAIRQIAEEYME